MLTSMVLSLIMLFNLCSCQGRIYAQDLTGDVEKLSPVGKQADDEFKEQQLQLCSKLFKSAVSESENKNVLISPLSIQLALSLTANGADS